jgi:galactose mutarotase-like enzyme
MNGGSVHPVVHLQNEGADAEIVPAEGARVQHLRDRRSGRELLLQRTPEPGPRVDFLAACTGGWDELFPTDSEWGEHPDHGRVWTAAFDVVKADDSSVTLRTTLGSPPAEIERRLTLLESPRRGLRAETTLRAHGATGPFLWAAHPMLAVEEGWRIELPAGGRDFEADRELPGRPAPGPLDEAQIAETATIPARRDEVCEVIYVDGVASAAVRSPDGARQTGARWDGDFLRHLWLVTITGRFGLDDCLLIEPCTSRPYRLEEAIEQGTAASFGPGEEARWWFELESLDELSSGVEA